MSPDRPKGRLVWLRLNSYGVLLCGLMLLAGLDILDPANSQVARLVGAVPALQPVWTYGYIFAALLILAGFTRSKALPEAIGLAVLVVALTIQTYVLLGIPGGTPREVAVWLIVAASAAARGSMLFGYDMTITRHKRGGVQ